MKRVFQKLQFTAPLQAIVFDCDGVLFDSKQANVKFYSHILERFGRPPVSHEQEDFIHMYPVRESLKYLFGEGEDFQAAWVYLRQIDFGAFNSYLRREPGLVEILEMAKANFRTALATNRMVSTRELLAHFDIEKYFDLVVSASDVRYPKPHPETMEKILETFRISPAQVLYVGDSAVDEALAEATGVFFVAYKNENLKAHMHIHHFQELQPVLLSRRPVSGG